MLFLDLVKSAPPGKFDDKETANCKLSLSISQVGWLWLDFSRVGDGWTLH